MERKSYIPCFSVSVGRKREAGAVQPIAAMGSSKVVKESGYGILPTGAGWGEVPPGEGVSWLIGEQTGVHKTGRRVWLPATLLLIPFHYQRPRSINFFERSTSSDSLWEGAPASLLSHGHSELWLAWLKQAQVRLVLAVHLRTGIHGTQILQADSM